MMDNAECDRMLAELDRLLNDPDSRMEPDKVWQLLARLADQDTPPASI